ncbi:MAG: hypothetical protein HC767_00195, partial [Akkermansiaceae bacterium]|nr:hypothetical protein [Akkermansiaceae bacterium]
MEPLGTDPTPASGTPFAAALYCSLASYARQTHSPRLLRFQPLIDFLLRPDAALSVPAQANGFRPPTSVPQNFGVHQVVVQHEVGPAETLDAAKRDQTRIAG